MTGSMTTSTASESSSSSYLYEIISALWVHSWTSFAAQLREEKQLKGSSATLSMWPYEVIQGSNNPSAEEKTATSFIRNISFFLPLMLKSLAIRCAKRPTTPLVIPMTFLDDWHMQILIPLVETIALGTMREAMSGSSGISNADQMLAKALSTNQYSIDFLIGLFACLHPSQVSTLINAYFSMLDECEQPIAFSKSRTVDSSDKQNLRRVKCTRLIRLQAVEKLAVMPGFIAVNYPPKYTGYCPKKTPSSTTWTNQSSKNNPPDSNELQACLEKIDRYPQSFWLSHLLMDQCLSISLRCCNAIIMEAKAQMKTNRYGNKEVSNPLTQEGLLCLEAIAFQAASCAQNLLIRRHAIDSRFQTIECNTRVAAMFVDPVLEKLVFCLSVLSRLEPNQKVRTCWVLCLLYVLQESPEVLLRSKLQSFCQQDVSDIKLYRIIPYHAYSFSSLYCHANFRIITSTILSIS
jgi:hypothetical protein